MPKGKKRKLILGMTLGQLGLLLPLALMTFCLVLAVTTWGTYTYLANIKNETKVSGVIPLTATPWTLTKVQLSDSPTVTQIPTLVPQKVEVIPSYTPLPTYTLQATYTPLPTYTFVPSRTPTKISDAKAPPTNTKTSTTQAPTKMVGARPGDQAEFKRYLLANYSSIAGYKVDIEEVFLITETGMRSVSLQLSDAGDNVFREQTKAAALDYAKRLLADTKIFFGNTDCSAYVSHIFYTSYLSTYLGNDWYYVGDYSVYERGWYVSKSYVVSHYLRERESIRVWNYK